MRHAIITLLVMTSAGCSLIQPAPPQPVSYACDAGRGFSVTYLPSHEAATIEIARSRFALQAEADNGPGERYGCSVLTLWRDGNTARVDMQGVGVYENCRQRE